MSDETNQGQSKPAASHPARLTQYQLAAGVAQHVELRNVLLRNMSAKLKMPLVDASNVIESGKTDASVKITPAYSLDEPMLVLNVVVGFAISVSTQEEPSADVLELGAEFELSYGLDSPPPLDHRDALLSAFAHINGTYNAWPYLREFVQSTTARMTLPPVVLPVFRVTPDRGARVGQPSPTAEGPPSDASKVN